VNSNLFQGHDIIQRQIARKRYKIELYLQLKTSIVSIALSCTFLKTNSKSYIIYRTAPFSTPLNDPDFKVTPLLDAEYIRNVTRYIVLMNIIETYKHTLLKGVTSNDLDLE